MKLSIRKDGPSSGFRSKDTGLKFGLGRRNGGNSNRLMLLDPKHHSLLILKENRSLHEGSAANFNDNLGFTNLISPN